MCGACSFNQIAPHEVFHPPCRRFQNFSSSMSHRGGSDGKPWSCEVVCRHFRSCCRMHVRAMVGARHLMAQFGSAGIEPGRCVRRIRHIFILLPDREEGTEIVPDVSATLYSSDFAAKYFKSATNPTRFSLFAGVSLTTWQDGTRIQLERRFRQLSAFLLHVTRAATVRLQPSTTA